MVFKVFPPGNVLLMAVYVWPVDPKFDYVTYGFKYEVLSYPTVAWICWFFGSFTRNDGKMKAPPYNIF
jgi:hypothetical protein